MDELESSFNSLTHILFSFSSIKLQLNFNSDAFQLPIKIYLNSIQVRIDSVSIQKQVQFIKDFKRLIQTSKAIKTYFNLIDRFRTVLKSGLI